MGAIIGPRVGISVLLGDLVSWGVLAIHRFATHRKTALRKDATTERSPQSPPQAARTFGG